MCLTPLGNLTAWKDPPCSRFEIECAVVPTPLPEPGSARLAPPDAVGTRLVTAYGAQANNDVVDRVDH